MWAAVIPLDVEEQVGCAGPFLQYVPFGLIGHVTVIAAQPVASILRSHVTDVVT